MSLDDVQVHLIENTDDVARFMRWLSEDHPGDRIAFDTETTGINKQTDYVRLAQFGDSRHGWAMELAQWRGVVQEVLDTYRGDFVTANGPFDWTMGRNSGLRMPSTSKVHDVRPMHHPLDSLYPTGLKPLGTRYVDPRAADAQHDLEAAVKVHGWDKIPINFGPYWTYACVDTIITNQVADVLLPRVKAECPKAYDLELGTVWVADRMECYGAHVDAPYALKAHDAFMTYIDTAETWCRDNYDVAPGSNQAVVNALVREGFEFTKTTAGGYTALDKDVLSGIDHPLARTVLKRRQIQKLAKSYITHFLEERDSDDLIHCSINTLGARTGRMTIKGPALQTLPRLSEENDAAIMVRNCISARPGHTLLMCDFDQIEMRVLAYLSKDPGMRDAFHSEDDFFVSLARDIYQDPTIQKGDPRRQTTKNGGYACVPLSTEILTEGGWKSHDTVRVGDMTIGYNFETKKTEWTPVTQVVHYQNADTVRVYNHNRSFVTTPNHRWVAEDYRLNKQMYITTDQLAGERYRLLLSTDSSIGGQGLPLSEQEIRILGWAMGDGSIYQGSYVGGPSQAGGRRVACRIHIMQCKPRFVREIDALVVGVPFKRNETTRKTPSGYTVTNWQMNPDWGRDVLRRANLWQREFNPWEFATSLSHQQRMWLVESLHASEGNESAVGTGRVLMHQAADSPYKDLMIALGYLTGHYVSVLDRRREESSWTRKHCVKVVYNNPVMTGQRSRIENTGTQDVWCVQTGLGTWTMRQENETPVLTGNTIYGAGTQKFADTANIGVSEAKEFRRRWDARYPGIPTFVRTTEQNAYDARKRDGVASVYSPLTGRRHIGDKYREYALINYLIQGTAAELFKMKLLEIDASGLSPWMMLPVHDEIILDVPDEHVPDAVATLHTIMNDDQVIAPIPMTASVSYGQRWGAKRGWVDAEEWRDFRGTPAA